MIGLKLIRPKKGAVVTSATWGVTRPSSRGLFLIRDEGRILRDVRVEVGPSIIVRIEMYVGIKGIT
jgi:hypothetical protein